MFSYNHNVFYRARTFPSKSQWNLTTTAAREASGRDEYDLANNLIAQSIEEARDPNLHWSELQSALAGSALIHEHVTYNDALALTHYRESLAILNELIGADAHDARTFAECLAECKAKAHAADSSSPSA
ncbi:MAG: hypothetical protein ACR2NU_02420 [Aeoliella sp.]